MKDHPIRRALASEELLLDLERWADVLLADTGSGTVEITLEFNVKDRRFLGYRKGGAGSRIPLDREVA